MGEGEGARVYKIRSRLEIKNEKKAEKSRTFLSAVTENTIQVRICKMKKKAFFFGIIFLNKIGKTIEISRFFGCLYICRLVNRKLKKKTPDFVPDFVVGEILGFFCFFRLKNKKKRRLNF